MTATASESTDTGGRSLLGRTPPRATVWGDVIQRGFDRADKAVEALAAVILLAVVAIVLLGVFSRYVLNLSVPWTEEVALFGFLWLIVVGAAAGTSRGLHASMDSLAVFLPPRARAVLEFAIDAVVAATCVCSS